MSEATSASKAPTGRQQRKLRNLLLDKGFQLKYTGYLVLIAVVLSASLGFILWRTSDAVVAQSQRNVEQGEQVVALGDEVVEESRKVSAVVRMNIVKDPIYEDNPDLLAAFNEDASAQDARLNAQQAALKKQKVALLEQSERLRQFQRTMLFTLVGVLTLLVLAIGLAGIIVTHKVAGPIFKMKRHLREVSEGSLVVPWGLRKGDELVEFFETFRTMVQSLRSQREQEIAAIDATLGQLEGQVDAAKLAPLVELRSDLDKSLS